MNADYQAVRTLLARVRARWRRLLLLQGAARAALGASVALAAVLLLSHWAARSTAGMAALGVAGVLVASAVVVWGLWPARQAASDRRVARFVEERIPALDERLVSAVDMAVAGKADRPALADLMMADAARQSARIDPAEVLPADRLRRAAMQAAAAVVVLAMAAFWAKDAARQSYDALALALFPSRITLEVTPGDARVQAGSALTVEARLVGNRAPVVARLLRAPLDGQEWRAVEMKTDAAGRFSAALQSLSTSFRYKVAAGALTSPEFEVAVVRPPRVARIDVEYTYPKGLGLAPRTEEDGGDIYAPAGTDVKVRVHTDVPAASGQMVLGGGKTLALVPENGTVLAGALRVAEDNSYRVALSDREGLSSRGDTEYFIRMLEDRPPEVHLVRPAADRRVTPLEEVEIEAEAQDDFGVERLDLVYSVRGGPEKTVPLRIPPRQTTVSGKHTLFLEDLGVRPGDFITYYARARDLARGKKASDARSDIFFLEVKPFEQEFALAASQAAAGGGGGNRQIDDLVAAEKEIVVATWKLDRRAEAAKGAKSEQDIKSVARAQSELKTRVEETSSSFRESNMRDPRRRPQRGRGAPPQPEQPRAGQTLPEEDAMTLAANAMGKAAGSLDALKTSDALPSEMEALNQLLRAQNDVKKREVQRQQAGSGAGSNRTTQDLSSLFDKELARHQQTNYETPTSTEQRDDQNGSSLDKVKDLARRQDELLRRQQELARDRANMSEEELTRELEKLTREQNELRQRAEQMAQETARQQGSQPGERQQSQNGQQSQSGRQSQGQQQGGQQSQGGQQQGGQQARGGQPSQPGQSGQQQPGPSGQQAQNGEKPGEQGQTGSSQSGQLRDISEEMRNAASELRRQDASQASARAARALERLRDLERQLQSTTPDARRRALGDMQLEARQLADAQRQIASESERAGQGDAGRDTQRRLAGEEERLAERLRRMQEGLKQQSSGTPAGSAGAKGDAAGDKTAAGNLQQAAGDASREIDRQRLAERMQQSADGMRGGQKPTADAQQEIARALDRLADRLGSADKSGDEESRKLSGQLARAQELRDRMDQLNRQLEKLDQQASNQNDAQAEKGQPGRSSQGTPNSGEGGKASQGQGGASGGGDIARLREEIKGQIDDVRNLMDQLQRDEGRQAQGGMGFTFEGQGMTLSAPGTEGWKQDFAKWQELRRQATAALDNAETTLSKKLQEKTSKDRLASGVDDKAPDGYQEQVDSYFKAIASRKR